MLNNNTNLHNLCHFLVSEGVACGEQSITTTLNKQLVTCPDCRFHAGPFGNIRTLHFVIVKDQENIISIRDFNVNFIKLWQNYKSGKYKAKSVSWLFNENGRLYERGFFR